MNIRFTIEEENLIAIYAEDSRERTIDNINSAMPYMIQSNSFAPVLSATLSLVSC